MTARTRVRAGAWARRALVAWVWATLALVGAMAAPLDAAHAQMSDLAISATDSPDPVTAGGDVTYTVTVSSLGPDPATATLNAWNAGSLTFQSATTPAGWSCSLPAVGATPLFSCTKASFGAGDDSVFTVVMRADPATAGDIDTPVSTIFSVSGSIDPNPANDSVTVTTAYLAPDPSADVAIALSGPAVVYDGALVTYTLGVSNGGPDDATNVTVNDTLPSGMTFVSLDSALAFSCTTPPVGAGGTITCTKSVMAAGESGVFTLVAVAPGSGVLLSNIASISSDADDPGLSNNSATVDTTVSDAPPTAANVSGVSVPYGSAGTPITADVTGIHTSVAVGTAPAHGTVSIAGDVFTYTPTDGYYGADSFTYTATGPGGTSAPATVSLTVATPAAPIASDVSGVAVPYGSAGTPITADVTGVHSSVAVGAAPAHGTVSIAGDVFTYTPTDGYYGADSFTYTATGPGGTSAPATVSLTVATPAAPIASDVSGVAVPYGSAGTPITADVTGVHSSVAVGAAPTHGTVSIAGDVFTYTPTAAYYGADSFTYTATGPGGTSAPATVSLTVATPAPPQAFDFSSFVPYDSSDWYLSLSVAGVITSLAVDTGPTHGTAVVRGGTIFYTPTPGFYGSDSFTYTVTGPGGTSAPATYSLTVGTPAAPVAAAINGVAVPYDSAGTAIEAQVTGVHSSTAIATGPTHGTVSVSGDVFTYTPTDGYYGADSFTYTATGPGSTSAPATVSLTVATPGAPVAADISGVAIAYNAGGTPIPAQVSGVHFGISVAQQPAHGTVSVSDDNLVYTPADDYFGADSFTYTATGPGGTSAPATVSLTVATPSAPTASNISGVAVPYGSSGAAVQTQAHGVFSSIAIATGPAHGTTSVSGEVITYTPADDYFGADSFTYTATGPGGTSAPATISLTVATPSAPTASNISGVAVPYGSSGTAVQTQAHGVFSSIAIATGPAHGTTSVSGEVITYRPADDYFGADSFTYTATGPGGTSAPATVTLTVATPPAPTAADVTGAAVPYNSAGTAIPAAVSGVFTSVAVASGPAHGTTSVAAEVITYTPAAGYFGADSFTYTATGPGGTSAPATVSLTVATPAAPTASNISGVAVPYGSSGVAIPAQVGGVSSSIAIATAPAHGTASIAGDVITYTPAAGYFGPDSFTYTATGPGGTSAPATASLTVATPPAPGVGAVSNAAVPYNSAGTAITLPVSGVFTSLAVATQPAHGAVTLSGTTATYTPTAGYFGADSFTFTATGPGGTSAAGTVSVTVATPAAPTVTSPDAIGLTITEAQPNPTATIDLSAQASGVFTEITVDTQPQHGSVSLATTPRDGQPPLVVATYTANADYAGVDSFTFVATGPGGTSAPATVTIDIAGATPALQPLTATTAGGVMVSVDLTGEAGEGPFTGAAIVSVSPASAGEATLVEGGAAGDRTYRLEFRPIGAFSGQAVVTYTLSNRFGVSAPGVVTITVTARANPAFDPEVRGVADAQMRSAIDLMTAQIQNFMRRNEDLHQFETPAFSADGLSLNGASDLPGPDVDGPFPGIAAQREAEEARDAWFLDTAAPTAASNAADGGGSPGARAAWNWPAKAWVGGSITFGRRKADTGRLELNVLSSGISAGVDVRLSPAATVGAGVGYGRDITDVGDEGSRVEGRSWVGAVYGSFKPAEELFVDGVLGAGKVDFDIDRAVSGTGVVTTAERDGDLFFGSLSSGFERRTEGWSFSSYGRVDVSRADLGDYAEQGGGLANLSYASREVQSLVGALGLRGEFTHELRSGIVRPSARLEILREFEDDAGQEVRYTDWLGGPAYLVPGAGLGRNRIRLGVGNAAILANGWTIDFDAEAELSDNQALGTFRLKAEKAF